MKVTAIILCRENSSRLRKKHFKKIGKFTILEIIIKKLKELNYIDKIVIATGPKKKNSNYEKLIRQKKIERVNFFYHNKEENVTERVYLASRKFKNTFTLLISGDCILLDKEFIDYYQKKIYRFNQYDFLNFLEKKNFYIGFEGIKFFRTNIWKKVNDCSNTNILQQNPGYVVSLKPNKFKIKNIIAKKKFYLNKKVRLSIDTQSDLDFFRLLDLKKKEDHDIQLSTIKENINLKKINQHVMQRIPEDLNKKKIILITMKSKKFGLGNYMRMLAIKREISETSTSSIKLINLEKYNLNRLKSIKNSNIVIDVHFNVLKKLEKIIDGVSNKIVLIDQTETNFQNKLLIVPSLYVEPSLRKKVTYGLNYLIVRRDLFFYFLKQNKSEKNKVLVLNGGSHMPQLSTLNQIKKRFNVGCDVHIGPYIKKNDKIDSIKKIHHVIRNIDPLKLFFRYDKFITRLGVTVYELLAIKKKPCIILRNEKSETRLKSIFYLFKKKYINILEKKEHKLTKIKISFGCQNTVLKIMNFFG